MIKALRSFLLRCCVLLLLCSSLPLSAQEATPDEAEILSAAQVQHDWETYWDILENRFPMYDFLKRKGVAPQKIKEKYEAEVSGALSPEAFMDLLSQITHELTEASDLWLNHLTLFHFGNPDDREEVQSYYTDYCFVKHDNPEDPYVRLTEPLFENETMIRRYQLTKPSETELEGEFDDFIEGNLTFRYDPEGNYSYCHIGSFMTYDEADAHLLREMFLKTQEKGIQNIVLDIRGNSGGYAEYWMDYIVRPNIREEIEYKNYGFYRESPELLDLIEYEGVDSPEDEDWSAYSSYIIKRYDVHPEDGIFPNLQREDIVKLDKAVEETVHISAPDEEPLFTGKFWLLTDEYTYSASEYFLDFCKRTGFATIVGKQGDGDGACVSNVYRALPESGIVMEFNAVYGIREDGTNSEDQPVLPDVAVKGRQDALDVCTDLIRKESAIP